MQPSPGPLLLQVARHPPPDVSANAWIAHGKKTNTHVMPHEDVIEQTECDSIETTANAWTAMHYYDGRDAIVRIYDYPGA